MGALLIMRCPPRVILSRRAPTPPCNVSILVSFSEAFPDAADEQLRERDLKPPLDDARARHAHIKNAPDFRARRLGGIEAIG